MGRTACTEPQCQYKGDFNHYLYIYIFTCLLPPPTIAFVVVEKEIVFFFFFLTQTSYKTYREEATCPDLDVGGICLTLRRLMSYIYGAPILDVSGSHTTTQHSR